MFFYDLFIAASQMNYLSTHRSLREKSSIEKSNLAKKIQQKSTFTKLFEEFLYAHI